MNWSIHVKALLFKSVPGILHELTKFRMNGKAQRKVSVTFSTYLVYLTLHFIVTPEQDLEIFTLIHFGQQPISGQLSQSPTPSGNVFDFVPRWRTYLLLWLYKDWIAHNNSEPWIPAEFLVGHSCGLDGRAPQGSRADSWPGWNLHWSFWVWFDNHLDTPL